MSNKRSGIKTFIFAIIMSAPTPLIIGLSFIVGRSSTQIADFIRKTMEFLAILISFIVYLITQGKKFGDETKKQKLERQSNRFVGLMMTLCGVVMLVITFLVKHEDNGNVLPVLAITIYGGVINLIFWIRYSRLNKAVPNGILAVQVRLYRAKTMIDASVAIALLPVFIVPESTLSYWFDVVGSIIVALYLIWSGVRTIYKQGKIQDLIDDFTNYKNK